MNLWTIIAGIIGVIIIIPLVLWIWSFFIGHGATSGKLSAMFNKKEKSNNG